MNGRGFDDAFVNHTVAVVVLAVARLSRTDVRARVFARIVAIKVVITVLATLEDACTSHAGPDVVLGVRVAVVAARAAVCHVRHQVGLSSQHAVAVRVDAASVHRAGWSNRTRTSLHARRADERASHAGRGRSHGRRRGDVAGPEHQAVVDHTVTVIVDGVARFRDGADEANARTATCLGASTTAA